MGTHEGVLIAWKGAVCQAIGRRVDSHSASVCFQRPSGETLWFIGMNGPQQDAHKLLFLQDLCDVRVACIGPWVLAKKEEAIKVGDYRPISLVHSFAKLITKIVANRLAPKLQHLVANNQSAFIH